MELEYFPNEPTLVQTNPLGRDTSGRAALLHTSSDREDPANNANSWGDMLRTIEKEKRQLPWQSGDFVPALKMPLEERKIMERALDPIVMKYRDSTRESDFSSKKFNRTHTAVIDRVNTIKNTQFNIISHEGPPRRIEAIREMLKARQEPPSRTWNMFSHLPHEKQETCPILYDANYMTRNLNYNKKIYDGGVQKREFNIINNQYSENHDQKLKEEYNRLKKDMLEKYWETHDLDVITQEFYSDHKEIDTRQREEASKGTQGQAQLKRLPPVVKKSEGKSYDILTLETLDENSIKEALKKDIRKQNRLSKFKGVNETLKEKGLQEYEKWDNRRMNRVSYKRWQDEIERGYDFVTTQNQSIPAKFQPLPDRPTSGWEKILNDAGNLSSRMNASKSAPNLEATNKTPFTAHNQGMGTARGDLSARPMTTANAKSTVNPKVPALDLSKTASIRTGGLSHRIEAQ